MLTKDVRMIAYKALVLEMSKQFEDITFVNELREENLKTDQLVIKTSQLRLGMTRSVPVKVLNILSISTSTQVQSLEIQE